MDNAVWALVAIVLLIVANGFFSAAEIAIVTVRQSRLAHLIHEGHARAALVVKLKEDPGRFLATMQIGLTLLGSMASIIGGAAAITSLHVLLQKTLPESLKQWSEPIALTVTGIAISYFSLLIGELVPKSLALRHSERIAFLSAKPIHALARLTAPLVRLLTFSADAVLRLFGERPGTEQAFVSEEEVKHMVREGARHGIFDEAERQLIHSVFEFTDTSVREVMVPRAEIQAVEDALSLPEVLKLFTDSGFSRMPVFHDDLDHIVGVIHVKDLLREKDAPQLEALSALMHPAFFVPDSMQISDLLRDLQTRRTHMAIVVNEFGTVSGLLTIEDLLEEIVGEIRDEFDTDEEQPVQDMPDGSILVQGSFTLADLKERFGVDLEESADYRTVAGFVLSRLKRFPKGGEAIIEGPFKMTVVVLDGRRLRKIRIEGPMKRKAAA